jgi:transposase
MSQKDLILSLREKGLTAKQIYKRLVEIFGLLAIAYSTVTKIQRKTCSASSDEQPRNFGGRPPNLDHDARILSVLQSNLNASVREIAYETPIPKSTVFNILHLCLNYSGRNCRFVPHDLTETQRREHVGMSTALLSVLTNAKKCAWKFILTRNESWFSY